MLFKRGLRLHGVLLVCEALRRCGLLMLVEWGLLVGLGLPLLCHHRLLSLARLVVGIIMLFLLASLLVASLLASLLVFLRRHNHSNTTTTIMPPSVKGVTVCVYPRFTLSTLTCTTLV